jgi:hypothetical protein
MGVDILNMTEAQRHAYDMAISQTDDVAESMIIYNTEMFRANVLAQRQFELIDGISQLVPLTANEYSMLAEEVIGYYQNTGLYSEETKRAMENLKLEFALSADEVQMLEERAKQSLLELKDGGITPAQLSIEDLKNSAQFAGMTVDEIREQSKKKTNETKSAVDSLRDSFQKFMVLSSAGGLGNTFSNALSAIPLAGARAMGGPVSANQSYLVGERGPEIFTPSTRGSITPNSEINNVTNNQPTIIINGAQNPMAIVREIERVLARKNQNAAAGINTGY